MAIATRHAPPIKVASLIFLVYRAQQMQCRVPILRVKYLLRRQNGAAVALTSSASSRAEYSRCSEAGCVATARGVLPPLPLLSAYLETANVLPQNKGRHEELKRYDRKRYRECRRRGRTPDARRSVSQDARDAFDCA